MKNPFFYDETEFHNISEIYSLFVENNEALNSLYQPRHNFLCGDRGTGKSMLLRYMEPYCQFQLHGGWKNFITKDDSFLAFYFVLPKGVIKIEEFKKDIPAKEQIYEHYFNMMLLERILITIQEQLYDLPYVEDIYVTLVDRIMDFLDPLEDSIVNLDSLYDRKKAPYEWLEHFIAQEKKRCSDFINYYLLRPTPYKGCLSDYHSFILPLSRLIKALFDYNNPIYFLIDDASTSNVLDFQMKIFNTWMSNRDHQDLSIKIAAVPTKYSTYLTADGGVIDNKNDFQYVHLDNYGSKSESKMGDEIIKILNKRLAPYDLDVSKIFLDDVEQLAQIEKAKQKLSMTIKAEASKGIDIGERKISNRDINRYTMRQFYKDKSELIKENKGNTTTIGRIYAGINDIIAFSSYNIRDCLKICSQIFESSNDIDNISSLKISPKLQDKKIREISKSEIIGITLFKQEYELQSLNKLKNLIDGLGNLYRRNLLSFNYSEYGVTSFQVDISKLTAEYKEIIRIGVDCRYLLRRFYSERNGDIVNVAYALNKMFFPYFKLELNPFAGRIKLRPDLLCIAFEDPHSFARQAYTQVNEDVQNYQLNFDLDKEMEDGIDDLKNNLSELFR